MPTCDTVKCTDYVARVLGNGTSPGCLEWWVKAADGVSISWQNFYEDSARFGWTHWIAARFPSGFPNETEVAKVRVLDCNNVLVGTKSLYIPTGMSWGKWIFECKFGFGCAYSATRHSYGVGPIPLPPPPVSGGC